jgi:dimeric dUTPase (all-alpha-NTP-PPase superfamily)
VSIRKDLQEVEGLISRLISIGQEYGEMGSQWSHMKHKEDFARVWTIDDKQKKCAIEEVYAKGRDMALDMSIALQSINRDFTTYPTLTSIIERFNGTWIDSDLTKIKSEGESAHKELGLNLWSFRQMLGMFEDQINLAKAVKHTLGLLKESDSYKLENGIPMKDKHQGSVNIANITNSNIAVGSHKTSQHIAQSVDVFIKIVEAIESSDIDNKEELIAATREMEAASQAGNIAEAYKNFIALAANHMTIIAPFIPALSALL